ncbi:hypothetical protein ACJX0J_007793 [Zea mays]
MSFTDDFTILNYQNFNITIYVLGNILYKERKPLLKVISTQIFLENFLNHQNMILIRPKSQRSVGGREGWLLSTVLLLSIDAYVVVVVVVPRGFLACMIGLTTFIHEVLYGRPCFLLLKIIGVFFILSSLYIEECRFTNGEIVLAILHILHKPIF